MGLVLVKRDDRIDGQGGRFSLGRGVVGNKVILGLLEYLAVTFARKQIRGTISYSLAVCKDLETCGLGHKFPIFSDKSFGISVNE